MEPQAIWTAHDRYVLGLGFGPDDKVLYSCGMEGDIRRWRLDGASAEMDLSWHGHDQSVNTLALSADGGTLVTGSTDQTVKVWDAAKGQALQTLADRKQTVARVALSPRETYVAAAWYGGRVTVWDRDGALVAGIKASRKNQVAVAISPDETRLVSGGLGDALSVWRLPKGDRVGTLEGHRTAVLAAAFLPDGRLLSLGYAGTMRQWTAESLSESAVWRPSMTGPRGMSLDVAQDRVAVAEKGAIVLLSLADGAELARIALPVKAVGAIAFSHDGATLAVGTADSKIRLYDTT